MSSFTRNGVAVAFVLGVEPVFSAPDRGEGIYLLSHDRYFTPPNLAGLRRFKINDRAMLYLVPAGVEMSLPGLKLHALFRGVPRVALPPVRVHPADREEPKALLTALPLVQQIVDATSQASWFQFVRDLSGDSDVTIPGFCTACRIRTAPAPTRSLRRMAAARDSSPARPPP